MTLVDVGGLSLSSCGVTLDATPECMGPLVASKADLTEHGGLSQTLAEAGYVLLRGFLDRDLIAEARRVIVEQLAAAGLLDPLADPMLALAAPDADCSFLPNLAQDNVALHRALYRGPMLHLHEALQGGPIRHFDYTWLRAMAPGRSTRPHADIVYMGRGTRDLLSAWVPLGDVPWSTGGLMILEGSHLQPVVHAYGRRDVDSYCENVPEEREAAEQGRWSWDGSISADRRALRDRVGGRWLIGEYEAGDVLVFTSHTVHASLDNNSAEIRLSSDSRYQRADRSVDQRWVGPEPIGHGRKAKQGVIC